MKSHQFLSQSQVRGELDRSLAAILPDIVSAVERITDNRYVLAGVRHLKELVTGGGKRVRGNLLYEAYRTAGGTDPEAALRAGVAIELFHLFALVHDDVIDRAEVRRGISTFHRFTTEWLQEEGRLEAERVGRAQAILWGDFLIAQAYRQLGKSGFSGTAFELLHEHFTHMFAEVVIGQMVDVDCLTQRYVSTEEVEHKSYVKSALYSFMRPMELGVHLAGGDDTVLLQFCGEYGEVLGQAFQLQDDLFDVLASEDLLRKPVLQDLQAGQHTFFTSYIFEHGTSLQQAVLRGFWGRLVPEEDQATVRAIFQESGAVSAGEKLIQEYFQKARQVVERTPLDGESAAVWLGFIRQLESRRR